VRQEVGLETNGTQDGRGMGQERVRDGGAGER